MPCGDEKDLTDLIMYKKLTVIQNTIPSLSISTLLGCLLSEPAPHAVYVDHLMIHYCMHTASHSSPSYQPELLELIIMKHLFYVLWPEIQTILESL